MPFTFGSCTVRDRLGYVMKMMTLSYPDKDNMAINGRSQQKIGPNDRIYVHRYSKVDSRVPPSLQVKNAHVLVLEKEETFSYIDCMFTSTYIYIYVYTLIRSCNFFLQTH